MAIKVINSGTNIIQIMLIYMLTKIIFYFLIYNQSKVFFNKIK